MTDHLSVIYVNQSLQQGEISNAMYRVILGLKDLNVLNVTKDSQKINLSRFICEYIQGRGLITASIVQKDLLNSGFQNHTLQSIWTKDHICVICVEEGLDRNLS